jgi:uncharacterized protein
MGEGIRRGFREKIRTRLLKVLSIAFVLWFFAGAVSLASALDVPPLRGRVNDYAGMLPADSARALEERLKQFERETTNQIVILTVPGLEGDALEDFSIRVAESWKIGQKGVANGAILIIAQKERKIRIEVGYGFEGVLPDAIVSRIIREVIAPRFKSSDYAGGIEAGIDSILKVTTGETLPAASRSQRRQSSGVSLALGALLMAALFALIIGITQRTVPHGAFGGAGAAGITSAIGAASGGPGFWLLAILTGAVIGGLSSYFVRKNWGRAWTARGSRGYEPWGGGGWGGGGFDSGDFGGSGFSGGGGDFGGGGASGDW